MSYKNPQGLVSTEWLADHLNAPDVRVVDATWFMPASGKKGIDAFEEGHIPGARHFDIDDIADTKNTLPHMLPSAEKFSSRVRKMGLGDGCRIVIYDGNFSCLAASRVWWTFRYFGCEDVALLDGGLNKWIEEGREIEEGPAQPAQERHFTPRQNNFILRNKDQMIANIKARRDQVVDARSVERFRGEGQEPWPHIKMGRIPNSLNVPFDLLVNKEKQGMFRSASEMTSIFDAAGVDPRKPMVASCGSGVTATVLAFAAYLLGNKDAAVYDGSWAEWGLAEDTPAETST